MGCQEVLSTEKTDTHQHLVDKEIIYIEEEIETSAPQMISPADFLASKINREPSLCRRETDRSRATQSLRYESEK